MKKKAKEKVKEAVAPANGKIVVEVKKKPMKKGKC